MSVRKQVQEKTYAMTEIQRLKLYVNLFLLTLNKNNNFFHTPQEKFASDNVTQSKSLTLLKPSFYIKPHGAIIGVTC